MSFNQRPPQTHTHTYTFATHMHHTMHHKDSHAPHTFICCCYSSSVVAAPGDVSILQFSSPNSIRLNDRDWIGVNFSLPAFPRTPRSPVRMLFNKQKRKRVRMKFRT